MSDDLDEVAIQRRRRRFISLALAGIALGAPVVEAQTDAGTDAAVEEAAPEPCLCACSTPGRE